MVERADVLQVLSSKTQRVCDYAIGATFFLNKEFSLRISRAERGRISDIFLSRECASPGGFLFDRK